MDRFRSFRAGRKERRARKRERIKARSRPYRILRGTGAFLLRSFVAVTAASLIFNAVSQPPEYLEATTGHTAKVGSADVHYEKWGNAGQAVVLLPGFAGSSVAYDYAGPKLAAKGYAVYAVDLPGFGYTRGGDARDIRSQADLVAGFAKKMGLNRPIVVGHSMGAIFALLLSVEAEVTCVVSLGAPLIIAREQGIEHLPTRAASVGRYVPKARRKLENVPQGANNTYRRMPLVSVHEMMDVIAGKANFYANQ